jgi:acyl dehydratase
MAVFVVPDNLKQLIGQVQATSVNLVEQGAIQRYANSVGDTNPLYNNVEYAKNSEWGRLMAPPAFGGWPVEAGGLDMIKFVEKLIAQGAPMGLLDGGVDYEFLAPIGAGDTLVAVTKIANIEGKETKMGATMVTTVETTFTNQNGAVACIMRNTFLNF